jgi:hypothetical protein
MNPEKSDRCGSAEELASLRKDIADMGGFDSEELEKLSRKNVGEISPAEKEKLRQSLKKELAGPKRTIRSADPDDIAGIIELSFSEKLFSNFDQIDEQFPGKGAEILEYIAMKMRLMFGMCLSKPEFAAIMLNLFDRLVGNDPRVIKLFLDDV